MANGFSLFSGLMGAPQKLQYGSLADLMANPAGAMHQAIAGPPAEPAPEPPKETLGGNLRDLFSVENMDAWGRMASGRTLGDSIGGFFEASGKNLTAKRETRKADAQKNKTLQWLYKQNPEIAQAVEMGVLPLGDAYNAMRGRNGNVNYSLTPIYGKDPATGRTVLGTVGSDGSFKKIDTGGFDVAAGIEKVDAGTRWLLYDKRTGQLVGEEPKDLRGAEREKEIGAAEGKAAAAAPSDAAQATNALVLVDSLRNDPNRVRGTGASGALGNWIPASRGYDFQQKVDQAKAGAFLSAIQELRGMGALSNAEGATATAAVTRMNTSASEEEFLAALDDYERIVRQGLERSQATMGKFGTGQGMPLPQAPAPQAAPSGGGQRLRFNPATGKLE